MTKSSFIKCVTWYSFHIGICPLDPLWTQTLNDLNDYPNLVCYGFDFIVYIKVLGEYLYILVNNVQIDIPWIIKINIHAS